MTRPPWPPPTGLQRREFLKLMGASLAMMGLAGCAQAPEGTLVPYVRQPEDVTPGDPLFYASAMVMGGFATGVLVQSQMGRPVKVEGNELHPASLGATDLFAQGYVLSLYDPDRAQAVTRRGRIAGWNACATELAAALAAQVPRRGAGLRILSEPVCSPTLAAQARALLAQYPAARWVTYEPVNRDRARAGARAAFGEVVDLVYHLDRARVLAVFDADLLGAGPWAVRHARDFARARRVTDGAMSRVYAVESSFTLTGAAADHRLALGSRRLAAVLYALAAQLGVAVRAPALEPPLAKWVAACARDLKRVAPDALVVVGDAQPPELHHVAHAINEALGAPGRTVTAVAPATDAVAQDAALAGLAREMAAGQVEALAILGGNPAYTAPADLDFERALAKVPFSLHLASHHDETGRACLWQVPLSHELEAWSDARALDGTTSVVQPLIAPLYESRSAHEVVAALAGQPSARGHDVVRDAWARSWGAAADERWQRSLHDGVIADSASPARAVRVTGALPAFVEPPPLVEPAGELELVLRADPTLFDGRFANNGWLQECPKPLTKLTWGNAALVAPELARARGLASGDVVELALGGRTVEAPVLVLPGHPAETVTLHLGHGRTRAGALGTAVGANAYLLRTSERPWGGPGLGLRPNERKVVLAITQGHGDLEGRAEEILPDFELAEMLKRATREPAPPDARPGRHAWGMVIDLNACVGCSACVVACQAENNVPIVGADEVRRGREMHWMRIDRYVAGPAAEPRVLHEPMLCQHCENAPCELVCPVEATSHSEEGLNEMTYNRCVGTRYCSNNCPYKVRRFNFLQYADTTTPQLAMLRNPEVTVRDRGVMEKCTFCVQRIDRARNGADAEHRAIKDGEIRTACQTACPAQAIAFGDLTDPESAVSRARRDPGAFHVLESLGTRPRVTYRAHVRNPNPELA